MGVYLYPNSTETPLKDAYIGIPNPTSIVLDKSVISLTTVGQTEQLTATIQPTVSDRTITWATSDTTVATVSTTGLVTCVTPGECTITATTVNGLTATCGVTDQSGWQPGVNTVAYLKLDGNGTDSSGNGNDATVYNPLWATENGRQYLQGTYSTDKSGCCAVLPVTPLTSECTFQAWIKMDTNTSVYTMYMGCYTEGNAQGSFSSATMNSNYYWCPISNGYGLKDILGQTSIVTGWHLQTVTIKNGEQVFYLDGVSIGSNNRNDANRTATNTVPFMLNTGDNLSRTASCIIGDFILEDKVWTAQEITDYYDITKGNYGL